MGGATALVDAATYGHVDCLRMLLAAGAEIDMPLTEGWTALMLASQKGWVSTVKLLLEAGADVHLKNVHGGTSSQSPLFSLLCFQMSKAVEVHAFLSTCGVPLNRIRVSTWSRNGTDAGRTGKSV